MNDAIKTADTFQEKQQLQSMKCIFFMQLKVTLWAITRIPIIYLEMEDCVASQLVFHIQYDKATLLVKLNSFLFSGVALITVPPE